jgi:hypothetical protein
LHPFAGGGPRRPPGAGGLTVTSPGDSGPGTLRQAILDANNETAHPGPDTIGFAPALAGATISLTTRDPAAADGPSAFAVSSSITIDGGSAGVTVARSAAGGTPAFRLFDVAASGALTLQHLTLRGGLAQGFGDASTGGAIFNQGSLRVSASTLAGNSAAPGGSGGGISARGGNVTVSASTLSGNSADSYGGGILATDANVTVSNSTLSGNSRGGISVNGGSLTVSATTLSRNSGSGPFAGGGITAYSANVMVSNSTLSGNSSGGIYASGGSLTVIASTLSDNTADGGGGGIFAGGGIVTVVTVSNSTLSGNTASTWGGGIYATEDSTVNVSNSTLSGNTAPASGGGIFVGPNCTVNVINSTLSGNSAGGADVVGASGGGIAAFVGTNGTVTLKNTLVAGNTVEEQRIGVTPSDVTGTLDTANSWNNLVGTGGSGGLIDGVQGNRVGVINPRLAPLGNYGGPTQTMALLPGSPALNAGSNAFAAGATDQRGLPRIAGGAVDIGAFESQGFLSTTVATCDPGTGTWYLRNSNCVGFPDIAPFQYGAPGWIAVTGDWNGDGTTTIGVVDPSTMTWYLRNSNSAGAPNITEFQYGAPGWLPVVGDWNGDGTATVGVFDPTTGIWYLRNEVSAGAPDAGIFRYGGSGWMPVVGDWDGDGTATVGVVDPASETWYLRNENSAGLADVTTPFRYGLPGWQPLAGDWDGDGRAGIGVYYGTAFYLRNGTNAGLPDIAPFPYGLVGWTPLAGAWTVPTATTQAAATSRGASSSLATDPLVTGLQRTETLDQIFASLRKGKDTAPDSSGVNDNVG